MNEGVSSLRLRSRRVAGHLVSFEVVFALFLFSGVYKASPHLAWVPVDLTAILAVVSLLVAVGLLALGRVEIRSGPLLLVGLFGCFLAYALLTVLWTPSEIYVRDKAFRLASVTTFSLLGCALVVAQSRVRLHRFLAVSLVLALVTAAATIYPVALYGPIPVRPFGTTYLILGRMIGFGAIVAAWYLLFVSPSLARSLLATVSLAVLGVGLLLLDGRGPLAATVLTIGLLGVVAFPLASLHRRPNRLGSGLLAGVGAATVAVVYGDSLRVTEKFRETFSDDPDPATAGRLENWQFAFETWLSGRTITGHGLASWGPINDEVVRWPHNVVLELLVELGVVGLLLFSLPVVLGLVLAVSGYRETRDPGCVVVLALFVYTLLNAQVTGDLNENRFLFAAVGLLCYGAYVRRSGTVALGRVVGRIRRPRATHRSNETSPSDPSERTEATTACFDRSAAIDLVERAFPFTCPLRTHREAFVFEVDVDPSELIGGPIGAGLPSVGIEYTDEAVRAMVRAERRVVHEAKREVRRRYDGG
jgi:O-antigen ligase